MNFKVITGFFGAIKGGLLNDCRRGYSDVLSAIVAASVEAKELQVSNLYHFGF